MSEIPSPLKIRRISTVVATRAVAEYQAALPVNKVDATTAPTGTDNFAAGYSINSRWIDVTNDEAWVCVGDGVWQQTTAELASEIIYDNSGTNISSSTAQGAITDLDTRVFANDAKVSADGSVTTHSDVTDAGSGAIITVDERNKVGLITITLAVNLDTLASDVAANNAKVSNVTTDLSIGTVDAISVEIVSSDGTNAVLPLATGTLAGLMSAADKAKLDAIP